MGFDHLQLVYDPRGCGLSLQDDWYVIEGVRDPGPDGPTLGVQGTDGRLTLARANVASGDALVGRLGTPRSRGSRIVAAGHEAERLWPLLAACADQIDRLRLPYVACALSGVQQPTRNSSSVIATLLHRLGLDIATNLPAGTRFVPGIETLICLHRPHSVSPRRSLQVASRSGWPRTIRHAKHQSSSTSGSGKVMAHVRILALLMALFVALPAAVAEPPSGGLDPAEPCTLKPGPSHTVVAIIDAETLELDDGTQVRLVGIQAPAPPAFLTASAIWRPEVEARSALKELLLGETIELAYAEPRMDRWGRHLAHVFKTEGAAGREWVQGWMLRGGHARVDPLPDGLSCVSELLAHERQAMTAGRGLWSNPAYRIRGADMPQRIMRLRNTFQLIEGRVSKVAFTRGRVYVNFGDDWRSDFTAGVRRGAPAFGREAVARLQALEGLRVRVRGWIERRNGPYIELFHPLQIEALGVQALPPSTGVARGVVPPSSSGKDDARVPAGAAPPDAEANKKKRPEPRVPDALDL